MWQLSLLSQHESSLPLDGEPSEEPADVRSLVEALARWQLRSLLAEGSQASSALAVVAAAAVEYSEDPDADDAARR